MRIIRTQVVKKPNQTHFWFFWILSLNVHCWQQQQQQHSLSFSTRQFRTDQPFNLQPNPSHCYNHRKQQQPPPQQHQEQQHSYRCERQHVGPLYSGEKPEERPVDLGIFGARSLSAPINGAIGDVDEPKLSRIRGIFRKLKEAILKDDAESEADKKKKQEEEEEAKETAKTQQRPAPQKSAKTASTASKTTPVAVSKTKNLCDKSKTQQQTPLPLPPPPTQKKQPEQKDNVADEKTSPTAETEKKDSFLDRIKNFFSLSKKNGVGGNDGKKKKSANKTQQSEGINPLYFVQKLFVREEDDEQWVTVFPKTRISPGELVPVTVSGIDLLVIASKNAGGNRLYCLANSCPHLGTPLELGQLVRLPVETKEDVSPAVSNKTATTVNAAAGSTSPSSPLLPWTEMQVSEILQQDGCEDCIVCPLHRTAFALESGEVRGEWCPYPPVIGKMVGSIKQPTAAATFGVRVKGKDVQVRLNSPVASDDDHDHDDDSKKNDNQKQQKRKQSQEENLVFEPKRNLL